MEMWGRKLWRKLEPGARLAPTITQGGRVNGDAQRLGTTGRNARDEITVEAAIALPIEQKPDGRGTCGHTFLNARRTRGAVDEHRCRLPRARCARQLAVRVGQALK